MNELKGTGVAMVTPFLEDGQVDFKALQRLVKHLSDGMVEYLVIMGTTGESVTLSQDEQMEVLKFIQNCNKKNLPLVLGMGGNNTAALIKRVKETDLSGITAILSASPYYNKPSQEGIYQHYKALAEATDKPILLYNVPGRTSSNLTADTTLRLASDFKNIVGIKEASADMDQLMTIVENKHEDFLVISGEDGLTLPIIACGGDGVISVVANAYPKEFSDMVRAALNNEMKTARKLHYLLKSFIDLLFVEGNPAGVKDALKHLGVCEDNIRLPLWKISRELSSKIKERIYWISENS